jgi:hypothetical protein
MPDKKSGDEKLERQLIKSRYSPYRPQAEVQQYHYQYSAAGGHAVIWEIRLLAAAWPYAELPDIA